MPGIWRYGTTELSSLWPSMNNYQSYAYHSYAYGSYFTLYKNGQLVVRYNGIDHDISGWVPIDRTSIQSFSVLFFFASPPQQIDLMVLHKNGRIVEYSFVNSSLNYQRDWTPYLRSTFSDSILNLSNAIGYEYSRYSGGDDEPYTEHDHTILYNDNTIKLFLYREEDPAQSYWYYYSGYEAPNGEIRYDLAWDTCSTYPRKAKIGTFRGYNGINLPIYDPNTVDGIKSLRAAGNNGVIGCFELVETTHPLASPYRVATNSGIKAIAKE